MKFVLLALGITVMPDLYIWSTFVRGNSLMWSIIYWIPLLLIFVSMFLGFTGGIHQTFFMRLFFILMLSTAFPKLLFTLISIFGKGVGLLAPFILPYVNIVALILSIFTFIISLYGFAFGWKKLTVVDVDFYSEKLPESFDNYKIVQLSDLHLSTYSQSPETVSKLVDMVNDLNADAVVFTGGLVNLRPEELYPFMDVLSNLKARDGVFSVLGNHDYCLYGKIEATESRAALTAKLIEKEREMGWDLLLNENRIIKRGNDSISIIGVENCGRPPFPSHSDLNSAKSGLHEDLFKVLLSHDPTHWRREVLSESNIDLTLAGHTHSMQFRIGNFSPSQWAYDEWGGLYKEGNQSLYVNTGTGSNVSFRFGAWPEITLITLKK